MLLLGRQVVARREPASGLHSFEERRLLHKDVSGLLVGEEPPQVLDIVRS